MVQIHARGQRGSEGARMSQVRAAGSHLASSQSPNPLKTAESGVLGRHILCDLTLISVHSHLLAHPPHSSHACPSHPSPGPHLFLHSASFAYSFPLPFLLLSIRKRAAHDLDIIIQD